MRKLPLANVTDDALSIPRIGILQSDDGITIFEPGDEETPEWLALHPAPDPLADAKALKRAQIAADRDAACIQPVTANGHTWQADEASQTLLNKAITLGQAGLPLPATWRDADNQDVPIGHLSDLLAIAGAIAQQTQAAYTRSWQRKAALNEAGTIEQVESV